MADSVEGGEGSNNSNPQGADPTSAMNDPRGNDPRVLGGKCVLPFLRQEEAISDAKICFEVSWAYTHGYIDHDTMAIMLRNLKERIDLVEQAEHLAHDARENRNSTVQSTLDDLWYSCGCQGCQELYPEDVDEDEDESDEFYPGQITEIVDGAFRGQAARVTRVTESKAEVTVELFEAAVPVALTVRADQLIANDVDEDEGEPGAPFVFEGLGSLFG